MPTYRSITLTLTSQYDLLVIPEYPPPRVPADPFCSSPELIDTQRSIVSTYVPTYPSSQFWLVYSVAPPHPPNALYYFKLSINGTEIVNWGCGMEDEFKGKTIFALSPIGEDAMGRQLWERRGLVFGRQSNAVDGTASESAFSNAMGDVLEVRVFRSRGRKRIRPDAQSMPILPATDRKVRKQKTEAKGIELVNAGLLPSKSPQRFYRYALLDPLDKPFATFRFFYRTMDALAALGVISATTVDSSSSETASMDSVDGSNMKDETGIVSYPGYADSDKEVTLSASSLFSSFDQNDGSRVCSTRPLTQASTFNSPLSIISEEAQSPESIKSDHESSATLSDADESPLRVPRPSGDDEARPRPRASLLSTSAGEQPSTPQIPCPVLQRNSTQDQIGAFMEEKESPEQPKMSATSHLSRENFKMLIQDCMPSPDIATLQIAETIGIRSDKGGTQDSREASRRGSSLRVGTLKRVLDIGGSVSRRRGES